MIRKAIKEDIININELGKLLHDNFEKTYLLNDYILNNNYIILVNEENEINGFIILYKNIDYYELETIVIKNEFRNQGIGTNLLNYFIKNYCKKEDIIFLEVSVENKTAIKLYKKFDFEIINIRKKYYNNIDAYVMKKVIK